MSDVALAAHTGNPYNVIVVGGGAGFKQDIRAGNHRIESDEPFSDGGTDTGPSPYELLLAALGSCTSMTVALYARKKAIPLERTVVRMRHSRIYANDCADCETKDGRLDKIELDIEFFGELTAEQRAKLLEISTKCPVHRTLTSEIQIITRELV